MPDFKGGVPTSLDETGQQWDYPNAWSPLEQIMTWSLQSIPQTKDIATNLAENWMKSNYMGWQRTRGMFEKVYILFELQCDFYQRFFLILKRRTDKPFFMINKN